VQAAELQQFRDLERQIGGPRPQPKAGAPPSGGGTTSGVSMVRREQMGRIKSLTRHETAATAEPAFKGITAPPPPPEPTHSAGSTSLIRRSVELLLVYSWICIS